KSVEAAYRNAKLDREVAEIAVVEYEQGIYPGDQKTLRDHMAAAQSAVQKAEARLERIRRARQRLDRAKESGREASTPTEIVAELDVADRLEAAEGAMERERKSLEAAKTKLEVLEKYTYYKMLKELKAEVEKARVTELTKQAAWELEKSKEAKLRSQIQSC